MSLLTADVTVLIPAAGRVPEGVMALSNIGCPAMIPVAGRPVVHWTLSYLRALGLGRYAIAVARRGMFVEDFVECSFGRDAAIEFLVPSRDGGLGRTVMELAERVRTRAALVVLGDTHFQFADLGALDARVPVVLTSPVDDSVRWCVAETDGDGTVRALRDKVPDLPGPVDALIGVYWFPDSAALLEAARDAVAEADREGCPTQMAAILERLGRTTPIRAVRSGDWLDCGNPDMQARSHAALLQKREFNALTVDPLLGTITKRSRRVEKFVDEINYLRLLPPELAVLFPRVVDYSVEWDDPYLTMEYYGYPTLAEVFVFENVDPSLWERIFEHLRDVIVQGFMRHRRPLVAEHLHQMCLDKTRARGTRRARRARRPARSQPAAAVGPVGVRGRAHGRGRPGISDPRRPVLLECAVRPALAPLQAHRPARQLWAVGLVRRPALRCRQAVPLGVRVVRLHRGRLVHRRARRHPRPAGGALATAASPDPPAL